MFYRILLWCGKFGFLTSARLEKLENLWLEDSTNKAGKIIKYVF
jgi:hypothetical protein